MKSFLKAHIGRNLFCIFVVLFALLCFLAFYGCWEYDEAWSYNKVQRYSYTDIITYSSFKYANNHVFNSVYFKFLQALNVNNVFFYRVISLFGFFLLFYSTTKIFTLFNIGNILLVPMIVAPYFPFYTQGRGYSLALGLFSLSLLSLLQYIKSGALKDEYLLVISGGLSSIALFSFIFPYASVVVIFLVMKMNRKVDRHTIVQLVIIIIATAYVYYAGSIVNSYDPYIIGSNSLIIKGSLESIISEFCYSKKIGQFAFYGYMSFIVASVIMLIIIVDIYGAFARQCFDTFQDKIARITPVLLITISMILIIFSHIFLKSKYPLGRALIYLEYLILLSAAMTASYFDGKLKSHILMFILFVISLIQFVSSFTDLAKPGIDKVVSDVGENTLYLDDNMNPAIGVTNKLYNKSKTNIILKADYNNMSSPSNSDKRAASYLYAPMSRKHLLQVKVQKMYDCRNNYVLYKIID